MTASPSYTWDDPLPPAPPNTPTDPKDDPIESDDIDHSQMLPPMPEPEHLDQMCGVDLAITPVINLDLDFSPNVHFLGDAKGEPVTLRLPEQLSKVIDRLIAARTTGYRTKSEFMRDAAYYLARALLQLHTIQDARLRSYLISADMSAKLDFNARLREQITKAEHDLTDYLLALVERNALAEAVRAIEQYEYDARAIAVPWWRERWLEVLKTNPLVRHIRAIHANMSNTTNTAAS